MDFPPEPKPTNATKSVEECSKNLNMSDLPTSDENDKMLVFSAGNNDSDMEDVENKMVEKKLYFGLLSNLVESSDSEDKKKNEINITKECKTEDKNEGLLELHLDENEQKEVFEIKENFKANEGCAAENEDGINKNIFEDSPERRFQDIASFNFFKDPSSKKETEEKNDDLQSYVNENEKKEVSVIENNFMLQINPQEDASRDGSYASSTESSSSGIETDFEAHGDSATESDGQINDNLLEDSSAESFHDIKNSDFAKDPSSKRENEIFENSGSEGKEQEKINLINKKDNSLKEDKNVVSSRSSISLFESITFPHMNPANCFDVVVPLIGKNVMPVMDIKPFTHRYDLARERNRLKGIAEAPYLPKLSYHEWRKQRDARSQEEKDREAKYEKFLAVKTAAYIIKTAIFILQEMQNDDPDEGIIERCFNRFLRAPVSPLSLLLSSQFVHVVMYIRGSSDFSCRLRSVADRCYYRCHVMFPILEGYNFETIYTSEVIKNIPDELNGMGNCILDYDDFEYHDSESDDSAFSEDNEDEVI